MRLDVWIGLVTFAMAVLGGIVSAHAPQKPWQKWAYGPSFVALGAIAMALVIKQSHESAQASMQLATSIRDLGVASQQIQRSTAETARIQSLNTELQKRLLASSMAIASLSKEGIATVTGGNSFCYMMFANGFFTANGGRATFIHHGRHPLYDVNVTIIDLRTLDHAATDTRMVSSASLAPLIIHVGNLAPQGAVVWNEREIPFSDTESQEFNIQFDARNAAWSEMLRLQKVKGEWLQAAQFLKNGKLRSHVIIACEGR